MTRIRHRKRHKKYPPFHKPKKLVFTFNLPVARDNPWDVLEQTSTYYPIEEVTKVSPYHRWLIDHLSPKQ